MLLDITFSYMAKVIPPRKRNEVERSFLSTVTVEIPELTSSELPVAFRWDTKKDWMERDEGIREVRWSEASGCWGKFHVDEYDDNHEKLPRRDLDAEWLIHNATWREHERHGILKVSHDRYHREVPVFMKDDPQCGRVVSTTEAQRRAEVEAAARSVMLVDGVVHRPASEPCYEVSGSTGLFERDRRNWLRVSTVASGKDSPLDHYRLDERDFAVGTNAMHEDQDIVVEVLVPEAVRAPLPEMALASVARDLLEGVGDKLKTCPRETMMAFADLRDANDAMAAALAAGKDVPGEVAGTLIRTMQDLLPHAHRIDEYGENWRTQRVAKVCERYDARSMALCLDGGPRP